tara:strand:+ start:379 stop:552 length:174 start_codon:yes stop_codon:yes gene_type:complete
MKKYIEERIYKLREEITIIDVNSHYNNLKITKFEKQRIFDLRSKLNILTEVLEMHKN